MSFKERYDKRKDYSVNRECPLNDEDKDGPITARLMRSVRRTMEKWDVASIGNPTEAEVARAYDACVELLTGQKAIEEEEHDYTCLVEFFQACTNFSEVTLTFGQSELDEDGPDPRRKAAEVAMVMCHSGDENWRMQNVRQTNALTAAVKNSGRQLHSLTLDQVSPRLFVEPQSQLDTFVAMIRPLRRIRMTLHTWPDEAGMGRDEEEMLEDEELD